MQGGRKYCAPSRTQRSAPGSAELSSPSNSTPKSGNRMRAGTARAYVLSRQKRGATVPSPEPTAPTGPSLMAIPLRNLPPNGPKFPVTTLEISTTELSSERAHALLQIYQEHNARTAGQTNNSITLRVGAPVPNASPQVVGVMPPGGPTALASELASATGATTEVAEPPSARTPGSDQGWGATGAWGAFAHKPFAFTDTSFAQAPFAQLSSGTEGADLNAGAVGSLGESQASGLADLFARKLMELAAQSQESQDSALGVSSSSSSGRHNWARSGEPELTVKSLLGEAQLEELRADDPLVLQALAARPAPATAAPQEQGAASALASALKGKGVGATAGGAASGSAATGAAPTISTLKHERKLNYGSLVSLPARLLHEFYAPSFGRGDVVLHDLWLNGQHLPLVVANERRGIIIVLLCCETYSELRANPQLVHQRKQYCVQLRQHFARSFCEPNNVYSYRDLLQQVHVVQCYLYVNERNVHAIFPPSTLKTYVVEGEASIHIRWPKQELLASTCEYLERQFTHENLYVGGEIGPIGSTERSVLALFNQGQQGLGGKHGLKWLAQDSRVPFMINERHERALLKNEPVSYQLWGLERLDHRPLLFDRLKMRPLSHACPEIAALIGRKDELEGAMSKRSYHEGKVYLPEGAHLEYVETNETIIMGPSFNNIKAPYKVKLTIKAKPSHDVADVELQPVAGHPNRLKILGIEHNLQRLKGIESLARPRTYLSEQGEQQLLAAWGQGAYERARRKFLQQGLENLRLPGGQLGPRLPGSSAGQCSGAYDLGHLTQYEAALREYSCVHLDALQLTAVQNPAPLGLVLGVLGSGRTQILIEKAVYSYVTLLKERSASTAGVTGARPLPPKVLILHYNLTLGAFIKERLKRHVVNLDLSHFTLCALSVPEGIEGLDLSSYDIVMVDEAQDVKPEFLFKILSGCTKLRCCYLFADFCQNIYHTSASLSRLVLLLINLNKVLRPRPALSSKHEDRSSLNVNLGLTATKGGPNPQASARRAAQQAPKEEGGRLEANQSKESQAIMALSKLLKTQEELTQAQSANPSLAERDLNSELTQCSLALSSHLLAQLNELERQHLVSVRLLPLSYRLNPALGTAVQRYKQEAFTPDEIGYHIGLVFARYMSWEREQYQARRAAGRKIKGTLSLAELWDYLAQDQAQLNHQLRQLALPFAPAPISFNLAALALERLRSELVRTQSSRLARAFVQGEVSAQFQLRRPLSVTLLSFHALSQLLALPFAALTSPAPKAPEAAPTPASASTQAQALAPAAATSAPSPVPAPLEQSLVPASLSGVRLSVRALSAVSADETRLLGALTVHRLSTNALVLQRAQSLLTGKVGQARAFYLSSLEDMWQQVQQFCALGHGTHAIFAPLSRAERRKLSDELTTSWAVLASNSAPLVYLDFMMRHSGRMTKTALMMQSLEQRVLNAIGPELLTCAEQVLYHLQQRLKREFYLIKYHHSEYLSWAVGPRYADSRVRLCAELAALTAPQDSADSLKVGPSQQAFLVDALLINEALQESRAALNLEASLSKLSFLDDYAAPDKNTLKTYPISVAALCHDYNVAYLERSSTGSPLGRIKPRDDHEHSDLQLLRLNALAPTVGERIAKLVSAAILALYAPSAKRIYEHMLAAYLGIGTDVLGRHRQQVLALFKSDLERKQRQHLKEPLNQALASEIDDLRNWMEQISVEHDPKAAVLFRHSDREIITDLAVKAEATLSTVKFSDDNAFYKERFSVDNDHINLSTIHSFKGAEADKVALILGEHQAQALSKELFYTGISRARQHLHILYRHDSDVARLAQCTDQGMGELKCVANLGALKENQKENQSTAAHAPSGPSTTSPTHQGGSASANGVSGSPEKGSAASPSPQVMTNAPKAKSSPTVVPAQFPTVETKAKSSSATAGARSGKTMVLVGTLS